ncbi:hypothetical protein ACVW1A_005689 [Bradyrhizobium sp. LB1.3]
MQGAAHLDVALLLEARRFAFALDLKSLPLCLQISGADLDHRILLDVVAQLALRLDVLHQACQTFGVEAVRGVEEFEIGLVEIGDRDRFQLESVLGEGLCRVRLEAGDVLTALLVHLLEGHLRGNGTNS